MVTAEDGVTSQRYYVVVTRAVAAATTIATALGQSIDELWAAALRPGSGVDLLGDLGPSAPAPYGDFAVAPSSGPGSGPSGELVSGLAPSYEQVRRGVGPRAWLGYWVLAGSQPLADGQARSVRCKRS